MESKQKMGQRKSNYKMLKHKTRQCPTCSGTFPARTFRNVSFAQMIISVVIILLDIYLMISTTNQDFLHICDIILYRQGFSSGIVSLATAIYGVFATRNATTSIIKQFICSNVLSFILLVILAVLVTVSLVSMVDCSASSKIGLVKTLLSVQMLLAVAGAFFSAFNLNTYHTFLLCLSY